MEILCIREIIDMGGNGIYMPQTLSETLTLFYVFLYRLPVASPIPVVHSCRPPEMRPIAGRFLG